jgi:Na+/melibiose symporter-like transporter
MTAPEPARRTEGEPAPLDGPLPVKEKVGYVANRPQSLETLGGIRSMMSTIPAALCLVVMLIALSYNLDSKTREKIESDLAASRKLAGELGATP